jgi:hypothetical protein
LTKRRRFNRLDATIYGSRRALTLAGRRFLQALVEGMSNLDRRPADAVVAALERCVAWAALRAGHALPSISAIADSRQTAARLSAAGVPVRYSTCMHDDRRLSRPGLRVGDKQKRPHGYETTPSSDI